MPPRQCPNCKNPKWNVERKQTTEEKVQAAYEKAGIRKPLLAVGPPEQKLAAVRRDRVTNEEEIRETIYDDSNEYKQ